MKAQQLYPQEGGHGNKNGVDEKQIESPEKVAPLCCRQAVAGGAERRHEGCGDGHTRDDLPLALGGQRQHTGGSAEEGNQHVIQSRRSACQQLAARIAQRRDEEVDRRRHHRNQRRHAIVFQRPLQQIEVADANTQSHADDGAHQRRDKHGADDDRRRVDVQPQRRNHDGAY